MAAPCATRAWTAPAHVLMVATQKARPLRLGEDAAMETGQGDPFGTASRPAEGLQRLLASSEMSDHLCASVTSTVSNGRQLTGTPIGSVSLVAARHDPLADPLIHLRLDPADRACAELDGVGEGPLGQSPVDRAPRQPRAGSHLLKPQYAGGGVRARLDSSESRRKQLVQDILT